MDFKIQLIGSLKLGVLKKLYLIRVDKDIILIMSDLFRCRVIKKYDSCRIDTGAEQKEPPHDMKENIVAYRPAAGQNGDVQHNNEDSLYQFGDYASGHDVFKRNLKRLMNITRHYYGGG